LGLARARALKERSVVVPKPWQLGNQSWMLNGSYLRLSEKRQKPRRNERRGEERGGRETVTRMKKN